MSMERETETSGFLDGRGYTAAFLYEFFSLLVGNGVYAGELSPTATNDNMTITHGSGHAWINGVCYKNKSPFVLDIATADGNLNRYDSLMLRLDLSANETYAVIVQGTPAKDPTPPSVTRNTEIFELKICDIYIPAGCTKITQAQVTDTRLNASVCGVPVFPVQHLDLTAFYQQIAADLLHFREKEQNDFATWVNRQEESHLATMDDLVDVVRQAKNDSVAEIMELLEQLKDLVSDDAVGQLIVEINDKLSTSGGTMKGAVNMGGNKVTDLAEPENGTDAATKNYVDGKHEDILSKTKLLSLWKNASPSTAYPAQTLVLDVSKYDFIAVTCRQYSGSTVGEFTSILKTDIGIGQRVSGFVPGNVRKYERDATITSEGIKFGHGYWFEFLTDDAGIGDMYAIPYEICGICGIPGKSGKSAYEYAQEAGYTGTEEEFATKLAEKLPAALPNPHALTINGQSYDGSKTVEVTVEGGSGGAQPDMNAAPGEPGHILNRTHWKEIVSETTLANETDYVFNGAPYMLPSGTEITAGMECTILINGTEYTGVATEVYIPEEVAAAVGIPAGTGVVIGNQSFMGLGENTGEPFLLGCMPGISMMLVALPGAVSFSITTREVMYHKIPSEYLPDSFGSDSNYTIHVSGDDANGYTADKTAAEILEAYKSGKVCNCIVNKQQTGFLGYAYLYNVTTIESLIGLQFRGSDDDVPNSCIIIAIANVGDGAADAVSVTKNTYIPSLALDRLKLTIGDTVVTYNGSKEVSATIESLKNPHALTINGQAYDGSEPVEIVIEGGADAETEMVLSDNLLDLSLLTRGKCFYYGSSGFTLPDAADSYYGFIPLRGAGTYRTKFQAYVHSATYKRIALVNDNNEFVANATGTHGEIPSDDTRNWLDYEFVVTQAHIAAGATKVAFDVWVLYLDQTMIVKDREYPSKYIPYGYIEVATDNGRKQNNVLSEKTAVFLGDSICAGTTVGDDSEYYGYGWGGIIGEANRMAWKNYGKNGGTITHRGSDNTCISTIADRAIQEYPGADYVIFEGGCNDADQMREAGLGEISSDYATFDTTTFSGAMENLILKLLTAYPTAKVGYIIPQKMYTGYSDYTAANHIHRKYFERAIEICEKWGIPYVDIWKCNPLNPKLSTSSIFYVEENGQHLTLAGYQRITPQIEAFMRTL